MSCSPKRTSKMKKHTIIITAIILSAGSFLLTSCNNSNATGPLKSPIEKNEDSDDAPKANGGASTSSANAGATAISASAKTIENLQAAFKGETTASAKYAAYAKKAEQEGYQEISLLFKAASTAENFHANNHKAVLQESGVSTAEIKPEFTVKTTKENLQDAINGESYEASTMYPEFLTVANEANNQLALITLNYAYKTEKKHKVMYENALAALQNNTVKTLPTVYFVCSTCGNTYENNAPARCGISMTSSDKFVKITSII